MTRRIDEIRLRVRGHWAETLTALGVDATFLDGKNRPCPGCGGRDRFQFNRRSEVGAFSCRHHADGGGDEFALVQHVFEVDFSTAARMVAEALGMEAGQRITSLSAPYVPPPVPRQVG